MNLEDRVEHLRTVVDASEVDFVNPALELWNPDGQTRIDLQARSLAELIGLQQKCEALALLHALISDAGRTELATVTVTAWAIGPADDKFVDRVSGPVPLL